MPVKSTQITLTKPFISFHSKETTTNTLNYSETLSNCIATP